MSKKAYSNDLVRVIEKFLNDDDWNFSFDDERGMFRFGLRIKGKINNINYVVDVKEEEYLVYAISPISADQDDKKMMTNMAEFICRANYGLNMGNFEFDFSDGEIRYKVHVPCEDIIPSTAIVKRSIYCPATLFEQYGSGIVNIIFNGASGKEAVEKCENNSSNDMRRMLAQLASEEGADSSDSNVDELVARLAARLGIDPTADDNDDDDD